MTGITYLRLSVTEQCDMRCIYCSPQGIISRTRADELSLDEISRLLAAFAENGVSKIRLTGGEPLLREDIADIIRLAAETPGISTTAITTNGRRLVDLASDLRAAGLNAVNISIDSVDSSTYRHITGSDAFDSVIRGLDEALRAGFEKVKTNTVVMRGVNDSEVSRIAKLTINLPVEARFIELMPLGHAGRKWLSLYVSAGDIREMIGELEPVDCEAGASARLYRLPGAVGSIGIISPMSEHFCTGCSRVRLTSAGFLKPCLRMEEGIDIRRMLDQDDFSWRLGDILRETAHRKLHEGQPSAPVPTTAMSAIGG